MTKKKILVLVDWFIPGYKAGGPIQSCANFAFAMRNDFSIHVLTTDTDHGETKAYEGITAGRWITDLYPDIRVFYLKKEGLSASRVQQQIQSIQADYIYLNHLFSPLFVIYPLWLKYRGKIKGEIVLCPRGALYDSALSVKPWKKTPFLKILRWSGFYRRITFHATNDREYTAIERFFPGSKILVADNLPNSNQPAFQSCLKEPGSVKCVFIARIVPIKNLLFLLQALVNVQSSVELTIIGPAEDRDYWQECQRQISLLPSQVRVNYLGPKRNDELMSVLQQQHLFILPTTGENFGHSIFEAFLAGRPVLISDQTPWLNLAEKQAGWDLPLNDKTAFSKAIDEVAGWKQDRFDLHAKAAWKLAHDFIGNEDLRKQYIKLFS